MPSVVSNHKCVSVHMGECYSCLYMRVYRRMLFQLHNVLVLVSPLSTAPCLLCHEIDHTVMNYVANVVIAIPIHGTGEVHGDRILYLKALCTYFVVYAITVKMWYYNIILSVSLSFKKVH